MAFAAILVSGALVHVLFGPATAQDADGSLQIAVRAALAILLCGMG